jgi:integrase
MDMACTCERKRKTTDFTDRKIKPAQLADHFASELFDKLGLQGQATMHGFRSSFRTWAAREGGADHVVADLALGHTVGTGVERLPARRSLAAGALC